jgi:shikimate kinase
VNTEIILIGPIGAGKSTVGKLLSEQLKIPQIEMDELRTTYYKEIGYDEEVAKSKREAEGFWGLYQYWKPFEAHAVERLLSEYRNCVIDFGAGHSVYEDEQLFKRVQNILLPYKYVILLLPSPDKDESIEILNEREEFLREMKPNINEHFIKHHSNYDLAKFTIYTKGKTPQETCVEILGLLKDHQPN